MSATPSAKTMHACFQIAQTLSFAIPPPWGPIAAAGIQVIEMLEGGQGDGAGGPNKELLDALTAQTQELENFLVTMKLDDLNADLRTMGGAVDETAKELAHASQQGLGTLRGAIRKQLDEELDWVVETDNFIERDLNRLVGMTFTGNDLYTLGQTGVELYLNMLTAYVCLLKLRCELRSRLIDTYVSGTDGDGSGDADPALLDDLYDELDTFWSRLEHWTSDEQMTKFHQWCDSIKANRLKLISGVQTQGKDQQGVFSDDLATDYFTDSTKRIYERKHDETSSTTGYGSSYAARSAAFTSHRDDVQAHYDTYVEAQKRQMEIDFSYTQGTIAAMKSQVNQVKAMQAPPAPGPLHVDWLDTRWDDAWKWGADTEFRYGLSLGNAKGASDVVWTSWQKSPGTGTRCPKLALPAIPLGPGGPLAETRIVHRELRTGPTSDAITGVRVALEKENTTLEYVDLDPADPSKVCPSPTAVPVVVGWQRTYAATDKSSDHPSWPKGYKVRYRYVYVNAVGTSLLPSGWAQPVDATVADSHPDGFLTGKEAGYLAELRIVRHPKATGVKVSREIGGTRIFANGSVDTQGRFFIFKDGQP